MTKGRWFVTFRSGVDGRYVYGAGRSVFVQHRLEEKVVTIDAACDAGEENSIAARNPDGGSTNDWRHRQRSKGQSSSRKVDQIMTRGTIHGIEVHERVEPIACHAVIESVGSSGSGECVVRPRSGEAVVLEGTDTGMGDVADEYQVLDVLTQRVGGQKGLDLVGAFARKLDQGGIQRLNRVSVVFRPTLKRIHAEPLISVSFPPNPIR